MVNHSFGVEFEEEGTSDTEEIRDSAGTMQVNTRFKEENAFIRTRTSSQMLEEAATSIDDNATRIASFIGELKAGDVRQSKIQGGIRIRRLTSGTNIEESAEPRSPAMKKKSVSDAPRTTIFASTEIGVRQERAPPFNADIMGTFSCHGFEPSDDTEDGIQQKINQDRGCVVYPFNARPTDALFMALDGHGQEGDRVAEFAMRQIVISLEKHPQLNSDPTAALREAFVTTNTALMLTPIKYMTSGTTVVAVYVTGNTFYIANVGDSRAVVAQSVPGSEKLKAKMLSRDHKPDCPDEMKRITEWGGFVEPSPEPGVTARVWLDPEFTLIGLAMARSIGDHAVKNVGVIPEPDVYTHELVPEDKFLILASDGVWEFIENLEAVEIVQSNLHLGAYVACQILIQTAAQRWSEEEGDYRDDVSARPLLLANNASICLTKYVCSCFECRSLPLSLRSHCPVRRRRFLKNLCAWGRG
jgi:protein phosphatase PTC2/3